MGTPADFTQLRPQSERDHVARFEKPHRVTLTKAFYLGKYEVTQAQWEKVMGYNPSLFKSVGPQAPVDTVSWDDCQAFCQKAGGGLRLPTEAEWEYACRAGTDGPYAGELAEMGWHLGNSAGTTHPVGAKKPNAWGLYDLHGNVREWCQDFYSLEYVDEAATDPTGPVKSSGYGQVVRGGGWASYAFFCRSAARTGGPAGVVGKGSGKQSLWEEAKADNANDAVVTLRSSGQRTAPYGLRPDFGCRFVIPATAAP